MTRRRAIALMSGGLDSNLAVRLVHDMGIEIIGVHFTGPFCLCNRGAGGCIHYACKIADDLGIRFSTVGLGGEYLDIVVEPKHGRGSGMNPCMDCRILMFRRAAQMMKDEDASFVLTGEVLGQRPMSQLRDKLRIIEREAGLGGMILRPLCAKHMPPTVPEKEGWVDRNALLSIRGRGRRPQMDLAEKLHIGDYPCPAGGCLLTDKNFAARLREHIDHSGQLALSDIPLLKLGRHFRLPSGAKLVVGRDENECRQIERMANESNVLLEPSNVKGPSCLLLGPDIDPPTIHTAARILSAYCSGREAVSVTVSPGSNESTVEVPTASRDEFSGFKI